MINGPTYGRQRDRLRAALTLVQIDHPEAVDELDAEGIVAFAERMLTHASDLRLQASLDYKQPLQQLFLQKVVAFDGNRFNRTAVTAHLFKWWLPESRSYETGCQTFSKRSNRGCQVVNRTGPRSPSDDADQAEGPHQATHAATRGPFPSCSRPSGRSRRSSPTASHARACALVPAGRSARGPQESTCSVVLWVPSSQRMGPPTNSARFSCATTRGWRHSARPAEAITNTQPANRIRFTTVPSGRYAPRYFAGAGV